MPSRSVVCGLEIIKETEIKDLDLKTASEYVVISAIRTDDITRKRVQKKKTAGPRAEP